MNTLTDWAAAWGVPPAALADLQARLLVLDYSPGPADAAPRSEAAVQAATRVQASNVGMRVWRNNVGVLKDERGVPVRFGLANDSPQVNERIKSGDLIGIRPRIITPQDVGQRIGQFVSWECKHGGWRYTGQGREGAQLNWIHLVQSLGGEARFINDEKQV